MRGWIVLVVVGACGGESSQQPIDAAIDAPIIDAPPDAPMPPTHDYVADRITLPTTNTQAREYGQDLDFDGTVDNQLGMVISTLNGMGLAVDTGMNTAVDRGDVITLLRLGTFDFTSSFYASVLWLVGGNPTPSPCNGTGDTVCRHHLAGTGTFTVTPSDSTLLAGAFVNGRFTGGPGHAPLQLVFPGAAPVTLDLIGARAKLTTATAATIGAGVFGGGVTMTDVDTKVVPAMRESLMVAVTRDCTDLTTPPGCGCLQGSAGKTALGLFDVDPRDCSISVDEVRNNSLILSLLAPDVTIENKSALSIGVGFTAVAGTFTYP